MTPRVGRPVHLDTSFLIRALVGGSAEAAALRGWVGERRPLAMSALGWGEFLCGPLKVEHVDLARRVVGTLIALSPALAEDGARLFNRSGRRRGSFADCLIAATALESGAELATADADGFARFQSEGLNLALPS